MFGDKIVRILNRQRGNLALTSIVYAIRKENDEPERGGSSACADDELLLTGSEKECSSKEQGKEVFVSLLHSKTDLPQNIENLGNQGNLLDKLKAVHLHVLAMEQWNASRLKLSYRYIFLFLFKVLTPSQIRSPLPF